MLSHLVLCCFVCVCSCLDASSEEQLFLDAVHSWEEGDLEDGIRAIQQAIEIDNYQNVTYQKTRIRMATELRTLAKDLGWAHNAVLKIGNGEEQISWIHGEFLRDPIRIVMQKHKLFAEWEWIIQTELLNYEEASMYPWIRAPRHMPKVFVDRYTLDGRIPVETAYVDEGVSAFYEPYSRSQIDQFVAKAAAGEPGPHYRETDLQLHQVLGSGEVDIKGKRVFIGGSLTPWYESVMLHHQAASVVTVEYNELHWDHEQLITYTPDAFDAQWKANKIAPFDIGVSISSFEHDGLGRYGDVLDPDGDLRAMWEISTFIKPDGYLILSVPVGADLMAFNCHRVYGKLRLPMLLANWTIVQGPTTIDPSLRPNLNADQPVFLLRNRPPSKPHKF